MVKSMLHILAFAFLTYAGLWSADYFGYQHGWAAAEHADRAPNFDTAICFHMGEEITDRPGNSPEFFALVARVKSACEKPE